MPSILNTVLGTLIPVFASVESVNCPLNKTDFASNQVALAIKSSNSCCVDITLSKFAPNE